MKLADINTPENKIAINVMSMKKLNCYISDMTFYNWAKGNKVPRRQYATILRNYGVEDV